MSEYERSVRRPVPVIWLYLPPAQRGPHGMHGPVRVYAQSFRNHLAVM